MVHTHHTKSWGGMYSSVCTRALKGHEGLMGLQFVEGTCYSAWVCIQQALSPPQDVAQVPSGPWEDSAGFLELDMSQHNWCAPHLEVMYGNRQHRSIHRGGALCMNVCIYILYIYTSTYMSMSIQDAASPPPAGLVNAKPSNSLQRGAAI